MRFPNNANLTDEEYKEIMELLSAFGYRFIYINPYPYMDNSRNIVPGLNIYKDMKAIKVGVVLSKEAKQKIMNTVKEYADPRLFGL